MLQQYHTKLKGTLALTDSYLTEKALQKEKGLYKFIWVRNGSITVEIDHQEMTLTKDEVISLTHLQHLEFKSIDGEYLTLLFNSNFYCIYGNDHEVSCSGFLFNGSSHLIRFTLNEKERKELDTITEALENEFTVSDSLQEEMLRILLKRFIIQCTITWSTSITGQRNRCRTMPICCINLPRHYRTSFLPANCLRRFGLSTNGWKRKLNVSCFTATKAPKRLPIFWDLKTRLLSAVSSKI